MFVERMTGHPSVLILNGFAMRTEGIETALRAKGFRTSLIELGKTLSDESVTFDAAAIVLPDGDAGPTQRALLGALADLTRLRIGTIVWGDRLGRFAGDFHVVDRRFAEWSAD